MEVIPAEEADMPRLVDIQFSAFEGNPQHKATLPRNISLPDQMEFALQRLVDEQKSDSATRILKCVNLESGVILGYAHWSLYAEPRPESQWSKRPEVEWCQGRSREIVHHFLDPVADMRERLWGGKPHLRLNQLCVHTNCERQGAGKALVQWGLDLATELRLPLYLEASETGLPLYERLGFRRVDDALVKAEDWDGEYDVVHVAMIRE